MWKISFRPNAGHDRFDPPTIAIRLGNCDKSNSATS